MAKSDTPKWILIGTGVLGLIAAGLVLVVRYYEINKARVEAARAQAEYEQHQREAKERAAKPSVPPTGLPPFRPPEQEVKRPIPNAPTPRTEVDLMASADLSASGASGPWVREGRTLLSPSAKGRPQNSWVLLGRPPGDQYRLDVVVERVEDGQGLNIGLVVQGARCTAIIDGFASLGGASGLEMIDGKSGKSNETTRLGRRLPVGQSRSLAVEVRAGKVTLFCEGERVFAWSGGPDRMSLHSVWPVPEAGQLFLGSQARFKFTKLVATALD